jgi:hypothetical protein
MGIWQSPKFVSFQRGYNTSSPYVNATLGLAASAQFDFVNRRYYWDGKQRLERDFTSFVGATFGTGADAGLIGTGTAADYDISLAWASLNISAPFVMVSVFRSKSLGSITQNVVTVESTTTPTENYFAHQISSLNRLQFQNMVSNTTQANQQRVTPATAIDTNYAIASLVKENLFRSSVNGAALGTEDTSGVLPTLNTLRLLEQGGNARPFTGRIRHVLFFQQTSGAEISQVNLNALSDALSRY